jgi:activator of HSP90 ATPase
MKTVRHKVLFKNASTKELYDLYVTARKHALFTGAPAKINSREGDSFSAHGNYITGENLRMIKDQLIVQRWRAEGWGPEDPDSTFIIFLEPKGKDTLLHAVHAGVPDREYDDLDKGWHQNYWEPMKKLLAATKKKPAKKKKK